MPSPGRETVRAAPALLLSVCLVLHSVAAAETPAPSESPFYYESTRSRGMGGAFTPIGDDATALLLNPAGLVTGGGIRAVVDYHLFEGGGTPEGWGMAAAVDALGMVFSAGAAGVSSEGSIETTRFSAGAARNIITGSAGSFLSVGAAATAGRLSRPLEGQEGCTACRGDRTATASAALDAGVMLRPLPFISLSASVTNMTDENLGEDPPAVWARQIRYGAAWLHEDRIAVAWESRRRSGDDAAHLGVSFRTAVPLEIMAGITRERISGGLRWDGGSWRASASFSQEEGGRVFTSVSVEVLALRPEGIYQ